MSLSYSSKPVSSFYSNVQRSWTMKQKRARRWCFLYRDIPSLSSAEASGEGKWKARQCALSFSFFLSFFFFFSFCFCFLITAIFYEYPAGASAKESVTSTIFACVADALNALYRGLYEWFRRVRGPTKRWRYYLRAWRRVYLSGLNLPSIDQVQ